MSMSSLFFFNDTATTEIYTLSYTTLFRSPKDLALSVSIESAELLELFQWKTDEEIEAANAAGEFARTDRKSTRLNSSHANISYAVFCLKKKNSIPLLKSPSQ